MPAIGGSSFHTLLTVSVPSGGWALRSLPSITNTAFSAGWAVLAADVPKVDQNDDTVQFGWAMLSSVLEQFHRTWPQSKQWPVACAGFSGGAKRSATVAAAMVKEGYQVIGISMGGCNEDRATLGLQLYQPGDHFKLVPIFLSNGTGDPIANPTHSATVAESMRRSGFPARSDWKATMVDTARTTSSSPRRFSGSGRSHRPTRQAEC